VKTACGGRKVMEMVASATRRSRKLRWPVRRSMSARIRPSSFSTIRISETEVASSRRSSRRISPACRARRRASRSTNYSVTSWEPTLSPSSSPSTASCLSGEELFLRNADDDEALREVVVAGDGELFDEAAEDLGDLAGALRGGADVLNLDGDGGILDHASFGGLEGVGTAVAELTVAAAGGREGGGRGSFFGDGGPIGGLLRSFEGEVVVVVTAEEGGRANAGGAAGSEGFAGLGVDLFGEAAVVAGAAGDGGDSRGRDEDGKDGEDASHGGSCGCRGIAVRGLPYLTPGGGGGSLRTMALYSYRAREGVGGSDLARTLMPWRDDLEIRRSRIGRTPSMACCTWRGWALPSSSSGWSLR